MSEAVDDAGCADVLSLALAALFGQKQLVRTSTDQPTEIANRTLMHLL